MYVCDCYGCDFFYGGFTDVSAAIRVTVPTNEHEPKTNRKKNYKHTETKKEQTKRRGRGGSYRPMPPPFALNFALSAHWAVSSCGVCMSSTFSYHLTDASCRPPGSCLLLCSPMALWWYCCYSSSSLLSSSS